MSILLIFFQLQSNCQYLPVKMILSFHLCSQQILTKRESHIFVHQKGTFFLTAQAQTMLFCNQIPFQTHSQSLSASLSPTSEFLVWYPLPQELAFSPYLFPLLYYPREIILKFCLLQSKDISFKGFALFNKAFNYMPNFHHFFKSDWSQQVEMSLSTHLKTKKVGCANQCSAEPNPQVL